jgi:very-long-chain enoyl-CoA reductase
MDPVHIKKLSHHKSGGSNGPPPARGPTQSPRPRRSGIKYATSLRPLPRRPVSSLHPSSLFLGHTASAQALSCLAAAAASSTTGTAGAAGMKVTVVSRSGREVVKGGIDLKDFVRAPASRPAAGSRFRGRGLCSFLPAGHSWGRFCFPTTPGFKISRKGLNFDRFLSPFSGKGRGSAGGHPCQE